MISKSTISGILLFLALCTGVVFAGSNGAQQDEKALKVLKAMSAFTATVDNVAIKAMTFSDARLDAGLIVSNSTELKVFIDRPGSMQISSFDGAATKGLYFHNKVLTVFNDENMYYAQAEIPGEIDEAMQFVHEELGVETPLMDLLSRKASTQLITPEIAVLYLTDKSRIGGVDCHHIALRGPESDIQLWIEEGARPVPRKIMITSKWEGGSPRFWANLAWDTDRTINPETFEFNAPEGAIKIEFVGDSSQAQ